VAHEGLWLSQRCQTAVYAILERRGVGYRIRQSGRRTELNIEEVICQD
jgi:hypothetical protein